MFRNGRAHAKRYVSVFMVGDVNYCEKGVSFERKLYSYSFIDGGIILAKKISIKTLK